MEENETGLFMAADAGVSGHNRVRWMREHADDADLDAEPENHRCEIPRIELLMMNISSPSKYVCNGKTYTTFQLAKMRMAEEKKYASGK